MIQNNRALSPVDSMPVAGIRAYYSAETAHPVLIMEVSHPEPPCLPSEPGCSSNGGKTLTGIGPEGMALLAVVISVIALVTSLRALQNSTRTKALVESIKQFQRPG
jgi:hypothetical protein